MKFLCVPCGEVMALRKGDDDASPRLSPAFRCPECSHEIVMQTNSGETQLVQSLGVQIGSTDVSVPPLAGLRTHLSEARAGTLDESPAVVPTWTAAAETRLAQHSQFLQPLIRRINTDYAQREGVEEITPEVMEACRQAQGLK